MQQPGIRRRVENAQSLYAEMLSAIEAQMEDAESDLWVWIRKMQDEAQRVQRQIDRAKSSDQYYMVLGVSSKASMAEIKSAWRKKMQENHPDRYAHDPEAEARAHRRAQAINIAYQELTALHTGREARRAK